MLLSLTQDFKVLLNFSLFHYYQRANQLKYINLHRLKARDNKKTYEIIIVIQSECNE